MESKQRLSDNRLIYIKPSMKIIDKINSSPKDKIILTGVQKSGKTTTLKCLANNCNQGKQAVIYVDYSNLAYLSELSQIEYEYYYELLLAKKIIEFIKNNNYNYYKEFIMEDYFIQNEFRKFNDYLCVRLHSNIAFNVFEKGMFINKILTILKQIIGIDSITLLIDHFDFVGNSSKRFQDLMSSYFNIFDKVILTTNDSEIKRVSLNESGYEIIDVAYAKELANTKKILLSYFKWWFNQINCDISHLKKINKVYNLINNDNFCNKIILVTNGNIDMMISILRIYFIQDSSIEDAIAKTISFQNEIDSVTYKRKLHL